MEIFKLKNGDVNLSHFEMLYNNKLCYIQESYVGVRMVKYVRVWRPEM
jgi:hypothetical protein